MSCTVPTTTLPFPCTQCVHPFVYLFEKAAEALASPHNRATFAEALDRLLDKGIVITNCGLCCPDCGNVYSLASVETQLKLLEAIGLTQSAAVPALPGQFGANSPTFGSKATAPCCSNVYASVETWLKYAEAMGLTQSAAVPALPNLYGAAFDGEQIKTCCNGFSGCVDDLVCWAQSDSVRGDAVIDRILDKGIAEFSGIKNNCTFEINSELCLFVQLLIQYDVTEGGTHAEIIDRLLDKGITVYCTETGEIVIASVETVMKVIAAIEPGNAVPALGLTTTTTTI